ncbi:hypothetical protein [Pendulispora brunnea]
MSNTAEVMKALQSAPNGPVLLKVRREKAIVYVAIERESRR